MENYSIDVVLKRSLIIKLLKRSKIHNILFPSNQLEVLKGNFNP